MSLPGSLTTTRASASGSAISLTPPTDYRLARDVCSYGYFVLAPNHWVPAEQAFHTTIALDDISVTLKVTQPKRGKGSTLNVRCDRSLTSTRRRELIAKLGRMLRLDESAQTLAEFHRLDPRFRSTGQGRLLRSPTFFEDVIKTVTSCNVTWPSTITMNRRLCEHFGIKSPSDSNAFPHPSAIARLRPASLRARCSVGYRDSRIVALAKMFVRGEIRPDWFEDPLTSDQAVYDALIELPGIGPYAAANLLQLLGRYSRLPLDTESVRHGKAVLGFKGSSAQIMKRVNAHFAPFGKHAFRSYWFEIWNFYESRKGPACTWDRETTGKTFTAAQLSALKAETPPAPASKHTLKPATSTRRARV